MRHLIPLGLELVDFAASLRDVGHLAAAKASAEAIALEMQSFDDDMLKTDGLQHATRLYRRRYVQEFLHDFFPDGDVDPARLTRKRVLRRNWPVSFPRFNGAGSDHSRKGDPFETLESAARSFNGAGSDHSRKGDVGSGAAPVRAASMGPGVITPGKGVGCGVDGRCRGASMGPGVITPGKAAGATGLAFLQSASMGPGVITPGKLTP